MEDAVDGACPVIRGRSLSQQMQGALSPLNTSNRFSWKDWDKPGWYSNKSLIFDQSFWKNIPHLKLLAFLNM